MARTKREVYKATFTVEIAGLWPDKPDGVVYESVVLEDGPPTAYEIRVSQHNVMCDAEMHGDKLLSLITAACRLALVEEPRPKRGRGRPKNDLSHPDWRARQQKFLLSGVDLLRGMGPKPGKLRLANALRSWDDNTEDSGKLRWLDRKLKTYRTSFDDLVRCAQVDKK